MKDGRSLAEQCHFVVESACFNFKSQFMLLLLRLFFAMPRVLNSGLHQQMWPQFLVYESFRIRFRMQLRGERKSQLLQYIADVLEHWCGCCGVLRNVMATFCPQ